eukprot:TRINITY_DN516_c0_g1_i1.p1 TRINITY_DN516_c0_g1~~TRINITY_DN516_c0_g1_i1.p1  ORF type:complete len:245 (+),score=74.79 TRINITY_DN516_c0_g1_i1:64-798(+)
MFSRALLRRSSVIKAPLRGFSLSPLERIIQVAAYPLARTTQFFVDKHMERFEKLYDEFHDLPEGARQVVVEHDDVPLYDDNGASLVYVVAHSDYTEKTYLEGKEAEEFLAKWEIPVSLPNDEIIAAPFGTVDNPTYVPTYEKYRIVSCQGHFEEPHEAIFMRLITDQLHLCPMCDQAIKAVRPLTKVAILPRVSGTEVDEKLIDESGKKTVIPEEEKKELGSLLASDPFDKEQVAQEVPAKKSA